MNYASYYFSFFRNITSIKEIPKAKPIALENALNKSDGLLIVLNEKNEEELFSSKMSCPKCGLNFEELQPRMFSFNAPQGACPECNGIGSKMEIDPDLIVPNPNFPPNNHPTTKAIISIPFFITLTGLLNFFVNICINPSLGPHPIPCVIYKYVP